MSNPSEEIHSIFPYEELDSNSSNSPGAESLVNDDSDWEILNENHSKRHWFKQNFQQQSQLDASFLTYH